MPGLHGRMPRQVARRPAAAEEPPAIEGHRVVRFDKRAPELPYIDAGFSVMPSSVIDLLPPTGACSFEENVFPQLTRERALAAEIVDHNFYEIGTPEDLAKTRSVLG